MTMLDSLSAAYARQLIAELKEARFGFSDWLKSRSVSGSLEAYNRCVSNGCQCSLSLKNYIKTY